MAEKIARPKVILNGKQIEGELDKLTAKSNELKTALKNALKTNTDPKGIKKLKREIRSVDKESRNLKKEMINVDRVIKDINGESMANIRKAFLKQSRVVRGLRKDAKNYNAEFEKQKRLKTAMSSFNGTLNKQNGIVSGLTSNFKNYFAKITAGFAAATGLIMASKKAIDAANERGDVKGNVKALTNLTGKEIDFLEKKAIEYSTTTTGEGVKIQKSADDILKAFQLVGSAQPALLKDKEALASVTREMLILGEAGENGIELKDAIDAVTKAMNQYGAAASETSRFTNAMAAGAQKGTVPVNEIGLSIKEFGVNAKAAHVPVEQSVALIEVLGEKAGVVGPRAGIQMRNFFTTLSSGADETNPEIVGLKKALENLDKQNMSSKEYTKKFKRELANTARILIANRGYINDMTTALTGTDTAYQQAITNTSDQKAALAQAKNKMHEVVVELGQYLAPAMTNIVSVGGSVLKLLLNTVKFFIKYKKQIFIITSAIIAYTAAVKIQQHWSVITSKTMVLKTIATKALAIAKGVLTGQIKLATIAQRAWNLAQKANPIGLIIGVLAAAGAAMFAYKNKTKKATDKQKGFNDELERTNELMGAKQYQEFLKQIGFIKQELVTLPDGSRKLITTFDENIDIIKKFSDSLKNLRENELENYKRFFEEELVKIKRGLATETDPLIKEVELQNLKKYKTALSQVKEELKKYAKIRKDINKDDGDENGDGNGKIIKAEEDLQKALLALRKKYGLVAQSELYAREVEALYDNHASKLLSEEEYQRALKAIYDKYHKLNITPVEMEPEKEVDDGVDFNRQIAEANYKDEIYKNSLDYQYDLLQQQWEKGEIGESEYNDRLNALDEERSKKLSEQLVGGMQHAHDMASQFISVLSSSYKMQESDALKRIENQKEKGIISEEEAEKEKAKIQEKYAKKQKELALKQAYIDIALAEIKAIASAPWPANIPALAYATAQGIASVEAIKAQEYEIGGYTNKGLNSKPAGIVHENEFVANAEATGNASVDRVLNIIDLAQKNGTISTLDLPAAIYKLNLIKGLQSGGYVSETVNNNNVNNSIDIESLNHAAYLIYEAAVIFKNKQLILTAEGVKKITETGKEIEIQNVIS